MAPPVVLVTGCSQGGLGFALAEEFNARGCITYASARSLEKLRTLPQAIRRLPIDVTDDHSVSTAVSTIIREQGQIDILLNNAGIGNMGPILDVPLSQVEDTYKTNVFGILRMCKAVVPHMASRRGGLVVNIGSVMGVFPTPWSGIYASSKAAVHSLSQTLAMELKPFNVRVMLVAPGAVKTQFANEAAQAFEQPPGSLYRDYLESIVRRINASHEPHALSSHEFAKGVVDKALRTSPPFFLGFAPPAFTWKIFSWLPTALVRYLLTRNFMTLSKKIKDA